MRNKYNILMLLVISAIALIITSCCEQEDTTYKGTVIGIGKDQVELLLDNTDSTKVFKFNSSKDIEEKVSVGDHVTVTEGACGGRSLINHGKNQDLIDLITNPIEVEETPVVNIDTIFIQEEGENVGGFHSDYHDF